MEITAKVYDTVPGSDTVISSQLVYLAQKDIIKVKREGLGYDIIHTGSPASRQVLYSPSSGKLTFGTVHGLGATVYVLYQH